MDLFETPEELPAYILEIIDKYSQCTEDTNSPVDPYKLCATLVVDLEAVGYTCDYGLDAEPYDLKLKSI
jgi:hypothetical protein